MKYIPNILTAIRILLIPVFISLYFYNPTYAAVIFITACVTDIADGYIARKYNAISKFGTLFDPLADKLLQISAAVCLYLTAKLPFLVVCLVIIKESIMIFGAIYLLFKETVVPSNIAGKISTIFVSAGILFSVAFGHVFPSSMLLVSYILTIAAIVSLSVYLSVFIKIVSEYNKREVL